MRACTQNKPEDRLPAWAKQRQALAAASGTSRAGMGGRRPAVIRAGSTSTSTRPVAAKVDSWQQRKGSSVASASERRASGTGLAANSGRRSGAGSSSQGQQQPQQSQGGERRPEYDGPDGNLAAMIERDMLDSSPGITCVLPNASVHLRAAKCFCA